MAYVINRFDSTELTTVEEGSLDQKFDLKFLGKNYAGYGEILNENFLFLLENFAGDVPPPKPISGQVWYDAATKKLRFHTGEEAAGFKIWKNTAGMEYGIEPALPAPGDMWFDTETHQLKIREETGWLIVGPQTAGAGTTTMVSRVVKDINGVAKSIIAATVNNEVIYIISKDNFDLNTLDPESAIQGWETFPNNAIKKGLNLPYSAGTGVTSSVHRYWGTASNADKLGGFPAADYIRSSVGITRFTSLTAFNDPGLTVGNSDDLAVFIDTDGITPVIQNKTGNNLQFKVTIDGITRTPIAINGFNIEPGATDTYNLGTSSKKWNAVTSNTINGIVINATTLNATTINANLVTGATFSGVSESAATLRVNGVNRSGSFTATGNSVAVRDASGNLVANNFIGLAAGAAALVIGETSYIPSITSAVNTIAVRDSNNAITANSFVGLATVANTLLVNNTNRVGATAAQADTVVVRDSAGGITANVLNGSSVSATSFTGTTVNATVVNATTFSGSTFTGTAARADNLKVGSVYYTGAIPATVNTIAVRDETGSLTANTFNGTAVRADTLSVSGVYRAASLAATANTIPVRDNAGTIIGNISGNAANSTTLAGLALSGTAAPGANQVLRSDSSGYVNFNYINTNVANNENPAISQVLTTNGSDNFLRKSSLTHLTSSIRAAASGNWPISISGSAAGNLPFSGGSLTGFLTLHANPTSALHAATKQYVDAASGYVFTNGNTQEAYGFTNIVASWDNDYNWVDVFPPAGKTMANLVAFIPSIAVIHFAGRVDGNDSIRCTWSALGDRIRVWVQNTEQRSTPYANWLAIWR